VSVDRVKELRVGQVARIICARSHRGFCHNAGGDQGCKVGRGTSDWTKCIASDDQLILSGHMGLAQEVLEHVRSSTETDR
jgi:hypothetical protein